MMIPRDLKFGDQLILANKRRVIVSASFTCPNCYDHNSIRARTPNGELMIYMLDDGRENAGDTPPVVRIERIMSVPKKVKHDKDADWLYNFIGARVPMATRHELRRLRAIARRLYGGAR